ncbi:MAG: PEGA domain-containing protein [Bacteroidales bacterium]|nr:PEGA domain-containing protein [Bacteroidales bacterium]
MDNFKRISSGEALTNQKKDHNGQICALIKINTRNLDDTQRKRLRFQTDAVSQIVSIDYPVGAIWLYISPEAEYLEIAHPDLSVYKYVFRELIQSKSDYEMTLSTAVVETIVRPTITEQYLVITVEPKEALVTLDGELIIPDQDGNVTRRVRIGTHECEVNAPMYYAEKQNIIVTIDQRKEVSIRLKPKFGYLYIESLPESGANVLIDGRQAGITPLISEKLEKGEYHVLVVKEMFRQASRLVTVNENDTLQVVLTMPAGFATPTFTTDPNAEIWINEERKGKGSWTGRLVGGTYLVEARREGYRAAIKSINLENGEVRNYDIGSPTLMYGILDLNTIPPGAAITIDGKANGLTPQMYPDFPVGSYEVSFSKEGYEPYTQTVVVTETKAAVLSHQLVKTGQSAQDLPRGTTQTPTQTPVKTEDSQRTQTQTQTQTESADQRTIQTLSDEKSKFLESQKTPVEDKLSGQGTELFTSPPKVPKAPKKQKTTASSKPSIAWFITPGLHVSANRAQSMMDQGSVPGMIDQGSSLAFREVFSCYSLSTGMVIGKGGFYLSYKTNRRNPTYDYIYEDEKLYLADSEGSAIHDTPLPDGLIVGGSGQEFHRRAYTAGVIWQPARHLHFKLGAGFGFDERVINATRTLGTYEDNVRIRIKGPDEGLEAELGMGLDFGPLGLSASVSTLNFKYYEAGIHLGLRFTFRK